MKRLNLKKRRFLPFITLSLITVFIFITLSAVFMSSAFSVLAESGASNIARAALYEALNSVSESEDFSDLSVILRENGKICGISLNSAKVNKITSSFASKANSTLAKDDYSVFNLPLGNLTGIPLLSGRGMKIPLRIVQLGSIDATVSSEFSSAGINQTKHSVYINAKVSLRLMAPFSDKVTETEMLLPLSETVIAGEIPSLYASGTT
ncbi:MAG: sporulation protein YunB [Clostridia bacterium]|nr:sporulation protein YunB [Clostridia bacterium]